MPKGHLEITFPGKKQNCNNKKLGKKLLDIPKESHELECDLDSAMIKINSKQELLNLF